MRREEMVERVWPGRDARSSCSAAGSPTGTSRSWWTARSTSSGSAARTRSCSGSIVPSSTGLARRRGVGVGPGGRRLRRARGLPRHALHRRAADPARGDARARDRRSGGRGPAPPARRAPDPGERFDSFRVVEAYAETAAAHGSRSPRSSSAAHGVSLRIEASPAARPGRLPQRLPEPQLHRRRRESASSTGSTQAWATLLRPRQLLDQPRASATRPRLSSRPTSAGLRDEDARGLRLMRFMSDFREAMWGVVQQAVSDLDFDFVA